MNFEKEYKKLVAGIKNAYLFAQTDSTKRVLENILPDLAESEDERIRKSLVDFLWCIANGGMNERGTLPSAERCQRWISFLEKKKEQKPVIQDVELNDAVYDYVRDHFIAGADFTPEYIKKLMENAFFAGVDYYLLKQESESCEPDTNVEKVIEDVIRVYGKTQGEWVGGYDVDTLIVNLRRAFNKKEQKPLPGVEDCGGVPGKDYIPVEWVDACERYGIWKIVKQKPVEWSEEDEKFFKTALWHISYSISNGKTTDAHCDTTYWLKGVKERLKSPHPHWKPSEEQMEALETAKRWYSDNMGCNPILESLYEQLKKL